MRVPPGEDHCWRTAEPLPVMGVHHPGAPKATSLCADSQALRKSHHHSSMCLLQKFNPTENLKLWFYREELKGLKKPWKISTQPGTSVAATSSNNLVLLTDLKPRVLTNRLFLQISVDWRLHCFPMRSIPAHNSRARCFVLALACSKCRTFYL